MGAEGIMLPMVGSAEAARELLGYVKYAPEGERGVALQIAHDRYAPHTFPNNVGRVEEIIVVSHMAQLIGVFPILFEGPVWWRRDRQMDASFRQFGHDLSGIPQHQPMRGRDGFQQIPDLRGGFRVSGDRRDGPLWVSVDVVHEARWHDVLESDISDIVAASICHVFPHAASGPDSQPVRGYALFRRDCSNPTEV